MKILIDFEMFGRVIEVEIYDEPELPASFHSGGEPASRTVKILSDCSGFSEYMIEEIYNFSMDYEVEK